MGLTHRSRSPLKLPDNADQGGSDDGGPAPHTQPTHAHVNKCIEF